jgi:hypothetical protein
VLWWLMSFFYIISFTWFKYRDREKILNLLCQRINSTQ